MKKNIFLFTFLIVISCGNDKTEYVFDSEKINNTNKIIQTLISDKKSNISKNSIPICIELIGNTIYEPIATNGIIKLPPKAYKFIQIKELLEKKVNGELFFSPKDSIFIATQNLNPKKLNINKNILANFKTTTLKEQESKIKNSEQVDFYLINVPVFSSDNNKAYIEVDKKCSGECGYGTEIYLEKINGKWKIIEYKQSWIN
jgi:hypothetical protein